jgi:hypothetical protein
MLTRKIPVAPGALAGCQWHPNSVGCHWHLAREKCRLMLLFLFLPHPCRLSLRPDSMGAVYRRHTGKMPVAPEAHAGST